MKKTIQKTFTKETCLVDHNGGLCTCSYSYDISQKEPEEDYIVVKDHKIAEDLIRNYKGKSLHHKWVIVAPQGLKRVSKEDIARLPQVKDLLSQQRTQTIEEIKKLIRSEKPTGDPMYDEGMGITGRNRLRYEILTAIDSLK